MCTPGTHKLLINTMNVLMVLRHCAQFNMKKFKYCHGKSPMLTVTSLVCQPGTFHETAHICSVCPVGTYQPLKGQNECHSCPENSYQDQIGSTECKVCDADSRSTAGSESCNQCEAGTFRDNQALEIN